MDINRDLTQEEWDLLRAIRAYRQIRKNGDVQQKEHLIRQAEDALYALIPTDNIRQWIDEKRKQRKQDEHKDGTTEKQL